MKIIHSTSVPEIQVGFAGSPAETLLQQKSDLEGHASVRWRRLRQLPLNNNYVTYQASCKPCSGFPIRCRLCVSAQLRRKDMGGSK